MLVLAEGAPPRLIKISSEVASRLAELQVATVLPTDGDGVWVVSDVRKVGVTVISGVQVSITPKTPVRNVLMMLSYSNWSRYWRDEQVDVRADQELVPAIAQVFARFAHHALTRGALRDYHEVERSEMTLRGRWDVTAQLARRLGVVAPLELVYDEYDGDVPENQILLSAALRLITLPSLDGASRTQLLQLIHRLDGVSPLGRGARTPAVRYTRRNERYRSAVSLGEVILRGETVQNDFGTVRSSGFLLTMSTVFEDFLTAAVADAASSRSLGVSRHERVSLDRHGTVWIEPDIVVRRASAVIAIIDAKYKVDHEAVRNPDVYQVVTYARRFGLTSAHLVYVGDPSTSRRLEIMGADVDVYTHALDLSVDSESLVRSVEDLVDQILSLG